MGGGGFVSGLIPVPSVEHLVFARTDVGGAYRWDQATGVWVPLTDWVSEDQVGFLGVESLAVDPNEPSRLYLLAGINYFSGGKTAILSSDDYGQSFVVHEVTSQFKAHGNGLGRQSGERLAVDPHAGNVLFTGTRENGLFRSADRGGSWVHVDALDVSTTPDGNGIAFVLFDPRSALQDGVTSAIYLGVSRSGQNNLYVSTDAGQSWSAVPGAPTTFIPQRAALASDGTLYLTYGNGAGPSPSDTDPMDKGAIWKLDAGGNWTEITPLRDANNRAFGGISVDRSNPARLLATTINTYQMQPWGYGDRIFLSTDAGASWTDLFGSGRIQMDDAGIPWIDGQAIHWAGSIEFDPNDSERAWVSSGNGIFSTDNLSGSPATFRFDVKGLEETVPLDAISIAGGPLITAIGDYDGFVHPDIGAYPQTRHTPSMGTTQSLAVAALAPSRIARVGSKLYVSSDSAASWTERALPSTATGGQLAFSADGAALLWTAQGNTFRSLDLGANWAPVSGLGTDALPAADGADAARLYAYSPSSGSFSVSVDGGASFHATARLMSGGSARIRGVPGATGQVWVALGDAGLTRSQDGGTTFEPVAGVANCAAIGFGAPAPGQSFPAAYLWGSANGGPRGLYRSDDAGGTWVRINDDAHQYGGPGNGQFVLGDANVYGRVYLSTAGRGLIVGDKVSTN
jgi:photosystem II stability/assembly factor-like uncharacterized protein